MWSQARKTIFAGIRDAFETPKLAPFRRHVSEGPAPELLIKSHEGEPCEGRPERRPQIGLQVRLVWLGALSLDRAPLALDLHTAGQLPETLAIHGKGDHRVVRKQLCALVDVPLSQIGEEP